VDSDQDHPKWMLGIMALQAEDYLDRIRENWDAANRRAVAEGKHIAGNAPIGYLRADHAAPTLKPNGDLIRDARLVRDPSVAAAVTHRVRAACSRRLLRVDPRRLPAEDCDVHARWHVQETAHIWARRVAPEGSSTPRHAYR
jgi:hypothetical protein